MAVLPSDRVSRSEGRPTAPDHHPRNQANCVRQTHSCGQGWSRFHTAVPRRSFIQEDAITSTPTLDEILDWSTRLIRTKEDPRTTQPPNGRPGDVIVVEEHHLGEGRRACEILEVLGTGTSEHYRAAGTTVTSRSTFPATTLTLSAAATMVSCRMSRQTDRREKKARHDLPHTKGFRRFSMKPASRDRSISSHALFAPSPAVEPCSRKETQR